MTETLKDWDEQHDEFGMKWEWNLVQFGNRIRQWMKWISEAESKPMNKDQKKAVEALAKRRGVDLRMNEPFIESIKWTTGVGKNDRFTRKVGSRGYRRFALNPDSFADWELIESEEQARQLHQEIIEGGGVIRGLLIDYPKGEGLPTFWLFSTSVSSLGSIINPYLIQMSEVAWRGLLTDLNPTQLVEENMGIVNMWEVMVGGDDERFMFVYSPPQKDAIYGYNYSKGYGN